MTRLSVSARGAGIATLLALPLLAATPVRAQLGTWQISGQGSGSGSAFGSNPACNQSISSSRSFDGLLVLAPDGSYRKPGGQACRRGTVVIPDEVGTWRAGRRPRSVVLEPKNLDELRTALAQAIAECSRAPVSVSVRRLRIHTTFHASADGQSLRGVERDSVTGSFSERGVTCSFGVSAAAPFRGTPVVTTGALAVPERSLLELRGGWLGK